jgi:Ca2+-binding EF-hand superfamily protein
MRSQLFFAAALVLLLLGLSASTAAPATDSPRDVQDVVYLGDKGPVMIRLHVRIDGKPLLDVWEEFLDKFFASVDADGDGVLSKSEAERMPSLAMLSGNAGGLVVQQPNLAQAIDKNQDGKITRDEFKDWLRRNGATPFQFRTGNNQPGQLVFVSNGMPQPLSPDALNDKLFSLLDTNKDGKLSREELAKAPAILGKFDLDDDETVSTQELSGNVPSSVEVATAFAIYDDGNDRTNRTPFVLVAPGEANKALAQRLLSHYGRKGKIPAKKLSREEIGIDKESFAQLDADEDGKLDGEELARFARCKPDLEVCLRIGKRADGEKAAELIPSKDRPASARMKHTNDDAVILEFGSTQIELANTTNASNPQPAPAARQQYSAQFKMADKDKNGYLDKNEAQQSPFFRNAFRRMDRDGDGKLYEKEIVAYFEQTRQVQDMVRRSCVSMSVKDQGRGLFDLADGDKDGRLSVREMRQMVKLIEQLDRDGDGQFSKDEIPHKYRVEVRRGPSSGNPVALNPAVVRLRGNLQQPEQPQRTAGPLWFRKMDRNRDGDVSRREFLGTDEEFRRIDKDGDGLISPQEAEQADKLLRKDKEPKP